MYVPSMDMHPFNHNRCLQRQALALFGMRGGELSIGEAQRLRILYAFDGQQKQSNSLQREAVCDPPPSSVPVP
jgi:hypothetical protein